MKAPRIAIPEPNLADSDYSARSWPQYARAVEFAGGEPVKVGLRDSPATVAQLVASCEGVLLPGSPADVNPQKYGEEAEPDCEAADAAREAVDELLLQDASNLYKPLLGICYGFQSLNVWRGGTLVQHLRTSINHTAGRMVTEAHAIEVEARSRLRRILGLARKDDADGQQQSSSGGGGAGRRAGSRGVVARRRRDRSRGGSRRSVPDGRAVASGAGAGGEQSGAEPVSVICRCRGSMGAADDQRVGRGLRRVQDAGYRMESPELCCPPAGT